MNVGDPWNPAVSASSSLTISLTEIKAGLFPSSSTAREKSSRAAELWGQSWMVSNSKSMTPLSGFDLSGSQQVGVMLCDDVRMGPKPVPEGVVPVGFQNRTVCR